MDLPAVVNEKNILALGFMTVMIIAVLKMDCNSISNVARYTAEAFHGFYAIPKH